MGTFNLAIQYPDNQQARILDALKTHWTTLDAEGNPVVPTTPQVVGHLRQAVVRSVRDIVRSVRDIVRKVEQDAARAAADSGVTDADLT